MEWFAVRHVIDNDGAFEERITLWRAASEDDAIARAQAEATQYATSFGWKALAMFQSYRLSTGPSDGGEVFSLIRRSELAADRYLDAFFDTGGELQRTD